VSPEETKYTQKDRKKKASKQTDVIDNVMEPIKITASVKIKCGRQKHGIPCGVPTFINSEDELAASAWLHTGRCQPLTVYKPTLYEMAL
jgi:hypothetical protein